MISNQLHQIKTSDGISLDGIVIRPAKRNTHTALIWIHGFSSRFSSGQTLIQELSHACAKNGIGYFKFNTRGHDSVSRGSGKLIGAGFEKFTDCIYDIRAMVNVARSLGFKKIILAGHSTGANKALYYIYKTRDRNVKKLILLGAVSDIPAETKRVGKKYLEKGVTLAEKLSKKNPHALMPQKYGILTAARFLSLYRPGSHEDVFPYYETVSHRSRWKELKSVRVPIVVIFGSRDEYLDRPAKKLTEEFKNNATSTREFRGIIIQGANHGFKRKEKELTQAILYWIKNSSSRSTSGL